MTRFREPEKEPAEITECVGIKHTAKAVLVRSPHFTEDQWVPQSVIHEDSDVYAAETDGTLIVARWWAIKQRWIDE